MCAKNLGNWGSGDGVEGGNGTLLLEMTNAPFFCTMRSISSRCGCGCSNLYASVPAVESISSGCTASYLQLIVRDHVGRAIFRHSGQTLDESFGPWTVR